MNQIYCLKLCILLTLLSFVEGLEANRLRNYNTDFLIHEAAGNPSSKRDEALSQFPTLGNPSQPGAAENTQTGRVKDLINLYDNKDKNTNNANKPISYSSVVQGSKNTNNVAASSVTAKSSTPVTPSPQTFSSALTTKPSFSSVVTGTNKHSLQPTFTPTTKLSSSSVTTPRINPTRPAFSNNNNNKNRNSPTINLSTPKPLLNNRNGQYSNSNETTDAELQSLSEELLRKDTNNAAKQITINYQSKTSSQDKTDKASLPLLTIADAVWNIPTVNKFVPLLDNYERDTLVNEYVTAQERNEETAFMDAIMSTSVIRHLMNYLKDKGHVTPDPKQQRDFLKQLWFNLYSRGKCKISSSGFEHVFVSELKNGDVLGLHNWIYFSKEETANRLNYLGYLKYVEMSDKGVVMKIHFNQQGADKPVDTMFVGTSPELEIALYTLCFVTRADRECSLRLGGKTVDIVTHTFRYRSKNMIGSAYPQI